jgi:zinc D-Ala-D-Ala carboxypeptidase
MLSEHFSEEEFTRTADPHPNEFTDETRANAVNLCTELLEPMRTQFGPLRISSGLRTELVNEDMHGAHASAHLFGCAADVEPIDPQYTVDDLVAWVASSSLPFDQVIDESNGAGARWCHVGIVRPGYQDAPRHEALVWTGAPPYTQYVPPTQETTV